ncbi:unnamed protein product [Ceratitis capitata]|uniref:(Mediterranean fruit fly) hypothetical protein n=1 Tax=Ceratitis capitata TaxID=7213 RepID=A0A811UTF1_CERCA|nr:unnamed protein product [Ceratitis capitata]
MSSRAFNFGVDDDVIIVNCVMPEEIGILSPLINPGYNEEARRKSIRNQWWNNNIWSFDLQKLCESFIISLLTKQMEYNFHSRTNGIPKKFEKETTYGEFEVNAFATKRGELCATYVTQFLIAVNFDECKIIKETILF